MRHAVPWIAWIAFALGLATLAVTRAFSPDRSEFWRSVGTDFAITLIGLAITVGVVDLLLKSYTERQRMQSITPRVREFISLLSGLRTVGNRYIGDASIGDLERYRRVVVSVQRSAFDLHMLISASNAVLASDLLKLSQEMTKHAEAVEDAISFIRNASADSLKWVKRVSEGSEKIFEYSNQLRDKLAHEYCPEDASS